MAPAERPPPVAEFADNIWLNNYRINNCQTRQDACQITFEWLALDRPVTDYTVFIQLWHNGEIAAGFDAPPLANDYPTSLWDAHEVIFDPHQLDLSKVSPATYKVTAGLYNFDTGERLPATADEIPLPDYAVDLGVIEIN